MSDAAFWNERAATHGHTGWANDALYRYDQPLRLRAISDALDRLALQPGPAVQTLDIGCGTGDVVALHAARGWDVLGNDLSERVAAIARERFVASPNVRIEVGPIEKLDLAPGSFDVATSVTVLQHLPDDGTLHHVLRALHTALRANGHFVALELAPRHETPSGGEHVRALTETAWRGAFERAGFEPVDTHTYPQAGVLLLQRLSRARGRGRSGTSAGSVSSTTKRRAQRLALASTWLADHAIRRDASPDRALYRVFTLRKPAASGDNSI